MRSSSVTSVMLLSTALENRTIWYQRVRRVSFVRPMASIQSIHFSMDSFQSSWLDVFAALPVVVPIPHGAP